MEDKETQKTPVDPQSDPVFKSILDSIQGSTPNPRDAGARTDKESHLQSAEAYLKQVEDEFGSTSAQADWVRGRINFFRNVR